MASNTPKENKMGVMPVKQLIISMALPMMISMLVQALYNVVDSIFVARLGEGALSAVTYAFPLQSLMIAVGSGTGVGMNALLSRSLGEKRYENSDAAANTGRTGRSRSSSAPARTRRQLRSSPTDTLTCRS